MNEITKDLLREISEWDGAFKGAYNIREDGQCAGRVSSKNIRIESKKDQPGLEIWIAPHTKDETVSIPACVTKGGVDDLVYNDFFVGENADVTIVAGCGIHTETGEPARHNGIHRFFLGKNSHVKYLEKHIGKGHGTGLRSIDPVTEAELEENAVLEMDTAQIGGVDRTTRTTSAKLGAGAKLYIRERILTEKEPVARDDSRQGYHSVIVGNAPCTGHSECDAIISENGKVDAAPELHAHDTDAALIHEAAIGKIAGEQILKLRTLGMTEEEAEATIIDGFLS